MRLQIIFWMLILLSVQKLASQGNHYGTVKGVLSYPSDHIPPMTVYIKNIETKKVFKLLSQENQRHFQFNRVPEGTYVAYAYTIKNMVIDENNKAMKGKGGYTHNVPCGLSVNCQDHSLISFQVTRNKTAEGVKIFDWYGAVVPGE